MAWSHKKGVRWESNQTNVGKKSDFEKKREKPTKRWIEADTEDLKGENVQDWKKKAKDKNAVGLGGLLIALVVGKWARQKYNFYSGTSNLN